MTTMTALTSGQWTPTGWGAQHRVRRSDEKWTELVCHRDGEGQRCETPRINQQADETRRCTRCEALPDLGPIQYGPVGEVRRSADGLTVVCVGGHGDCRWKVIGEDPVPLAYGWRDDWAVACFASVGNVLDLTPAGVA